MPALEIHISPIKPQNFAGAHSGKRAERQIQPNIRRRFFHEKRELRRGQNADLASAIFHFWNIIRFCRLALRQIMPGAGEVKQRHDRLSNVVATAGADLLRREPIFDHSRNYGPDICLKSAGKPIQVTSERFNITLAQSGLFLRFNHFVDDRADSLVDDVATSADVLLNGRQERIAIQK